MSKLRVGFVGLGRISDLHILGYRDNPQAGVYSVCDAQPEMAERRAQEWETERWCTDYQEMLADPALDALEILTPHHLHAGMTVAALEAGKHVSVQKPMAMNLAEAIELARVLGRLPPKVMVYGIEGKDFSAGVVLSPEVEGRVAELAERVLQELADAPEAGA